MGLERADVAPAQQKEQGMTFEQFIQNVATHAKLNVQIQSSGLVVVPFDMGEGRMQNTFVRPMGQTKAGNQIIGFFSPALKMPSGQMVNQKTANDLLRKNAQLAHGAWAIDQVDGADYLGVQDTQIAQTMDPQEFYASCLAVAAVADEMEKTLGSDTF